MRCSGEASGVALFAVEKALLWRLETRDRCEAPVAVFVWRLEETGGEWGPSVGFVRAALFAIDKVLRWELPQGGLSPEAVCVRVLFVTAADLLVLGKPPADKFNRGLRGKGDQVIRTLPEVHVHVLGSGS